MKITRKVKAILDNYGSDSPGVKANLARILMQGRLGGSGKMVILPVDQGFEHGPARSFAVNPDAYDPLYHFQIAIDAGLSAYAAPLGMIEAGADKFAGQIPTILKLNSSNSLARGGDAPSQAITGSVAEAVRRGHPGWDGYVQCGSGVAEVRPDQVGQRHVVRALPREARGKVLQNKIARRGPGAGGHGAASHDEPFVPHHESVGG